MRWRRSLSRHSPPLRDRNGCKAFRNRGNFAALFPIKPEFPGERLKVYINKMRLREKEIKERKVKKCFFNFSRFSVYLQRMSASINVNRRKMFVIRKRKFLVIRGSGRDIHYDFRCIVFMCLHFVTLTPTLTAPYLAEHLLMSDAPAPHVCDSTTCVYQLEYQRCASRKSTLRYYYYYYYSLSSSLITYRLIRHKNYKMQWMYISFSLSPKDTCNLCVANGKNISLY